MKTIVAAFLLIFSVFFCMQNASAITDAELQAMEQKFKETCIKETQLTDDEKKLIKGNQLIGKDVKNPTKNLQCFVLCYYKMGRMIAADGKLNKDIIMTYLNRVVKDKSKIQATWDKCSVAKGENECETAYNVEKCFIDEM